MGMTKLKTISEESLSHDNQSIVDKAILRMLFSHSDAVYFAYFLIRMRVRMTKMPPTCLGMGVAVKDGQFTLSVDEEILKEHNLYDVDTCSWILQHEAMHWVLQHHYRERAYFSEDEEKMTIWHSLCNIAMDLEIHELIPVKDNMQAKVCRVGSKGSRWENFPARATWEEYFEMLRSETKSIKVQKFDSNGNPTEMKDMGGNPGGRYEYEFKGSKVKITDTKTGEVKEYDVSDHGVPQKDAQEELNKEVLRQAMAEALKEARPSMGTDPGGLMSVIEKLIAPPRIAWQHRFRQLIGKNSRYSLHGSWKRFSRRLGEGFRGKVKDHGLFILTIVDTSGSVSDNELAEFDNEMKHIRRMRKVKRLHIVECDAAVQRAYDLPEGSSMEVKFEGRGGTDFRPAFEYIAKEGLEPDMVVYFTDSQGTFPDMKPDYPVIWCVTTQSSLIDIPWGDVVVMDLDKERGAAK